MGLALVGFVLVNIGLFGCFALFARGVRFRAASHERRDLEENSIIPEEWLLVRREKCGPTRCPRAVGTPPGPRKDVACEICAAVFMERYWQRMLSGAVDPSPLPPPRNGEGESRWAAGPSPLSVSGPPSRSNRWRGWVPWGARGEGSGDAPGGGVALGRRTGTRRLGSERHARLRRLLLVVGVALVLLGASLAFLFRSLFPGYFLIATGLVCLIKSSTLGPA
jgi:hypothetical protein